MKDTVNGGPDEFLYLAQTTDGLVVTKARHV